MDIRTQRLHLTELEMSMAQQMHENSLDEDNRRFVPDEVFETVAEAEETIAYLLSCRASGEGPQVFPVLLEEKGCIGYVQAVPLTESQWEIGYHIGKAYTGRGYATEAVKAFLPAIMGKLGLTEIMGICLAENRASVQVMEKCGFQKLFEGEGEYQGEKRDICRYVYRAQSPQTGG